MTTPHPALPGMPIPGPDRDRGNQLVVTFVVGCSAACLFVALRFWSRVSIGAVGVDDWCMLATALMYIPLTVLTTIFSLNGGTRHLYYLSQDLQKTIYVTKLNWIAQTFGIICLSLGKIAVALLIVRLLERASHWRKWSLYTTSFLSGINGVCMIVINFAQCKDADAIWNPALKATAQCWNPTVQSNFALYCGVFNTAIDFFLAILPITLVWNLKLNRSKRVGLCLLLGCGIVTGIISALKTSHLGSLSERSDITWETYILYVWTGVEITLIVVLGSLAPLRILYNNVTRQNKSTRKSGYYTSTFSSGGLRGHSRKESSYMAMDPELGHPLVDMGVPEKSYGGSLARRMDDSGVHVTNIIPLS